MKRQTSPPNCHLCGKPIKELKGKVLNRTDVFEHRECSKQEALEEEFFHDSQLELYTKD